MQTEAIIGIDEVEEMRSVLGIDGFENEIKEVLNSYRESEFIEKAVQIISKKQIFI